MPSEHPLLRRLLVIVGAATATGCFQKTVTKEFWYEPGQRDLQTKPPLPCVAIHHPHLKDYLGLLTDSSKVLSGPVQKNVPLDGKPTVLCTYQASYQESRFDIDLGLHGRPLRVAGRARAAGLGVSRWG